MKMLMLMQFFSIILITFAENEVAPVKSPQEEFCNWLTNNCPYFDSTQARPTFGNSTTTLVPQAFFFAKSLLYIDDPHEL